MKPFYTYRDVLSGSLPEGARLGVVGNPIAHSLSPAMQQAALDAEGLPLTYIRLLCEREEGAFPALIEALREAGFAGVNVTVPFKKDAYAVAAEKDALSRRCGAANTLVFGEEGISCFNTDGPGFARAVHELSGRFLSDMNVVILGACGGAGSALAAQCALSGCRGLVLANRPRPELEQMAEALRMDIGTDEQGKAKLSIAPMGSAELTARIREADLLVNATSVGLAAGDPPPIPTDCLREGQVVYDIVTHDTALVRAARERGCTASTGQSMLLWQGALAYEHWFGHEPAVELMRKALPGA